MMSQNRWLITGVAGFIGSHLLSYLLQNHQRVIGIDNFSTGSQDNLDEVLQAVSPAQKRQFSFHVGDMRDPALCMDLVRGVDTILHQAAVVSVPQSIEDPRSALDQNVNGMMNLLFAAKQHAVKAFVYASSSAVYGDLAQPIAQKEAILGHLLSPYAASKYVTEIYADVFSRCYGMRLVGLRYFNVFGARQRVGGAYASVIPLWIEAMLNNRSIYINGDGSTSRDFIHIDNIVAMNVLAAQKAMGSGSSPGHAVYNVGMHQKTTLLALFHLLSDFIPSKSQRVPVFRAFREGDIQDSCADMDFAQADLGYVPVRSLASGIQLTIDWYQKKLAKAE
jgi:UDP-N-acetylglucosamine 4-epimerase